MGRLPHPSEMNMLYQHNAKDHQPVTGQWNGTNLVVVVSGLFGKIELLGRAVRHAWLSEEGDSLQSEPLPII